MLNKLVLLLALFITHCKTVKTTQLSEAKPSASPRMEFGAFYSEYQTQFGKVVDGHEMVTDDDGMPTKDVMGVPLKAEVYYVRSDLLKSGVPPSKIQAQSYRLGNYPKIYHQGQRTKYAIVLMHGLSDGPFYIDAIAREFLKHYPGQFNIVVPLNYAHGMEEPYEVARDATMEKWQAMADRAVEVASELVTDDGEVWMGGLSNGGILAVNKLLRSINYSAPLDPVTKIPKIEIDPRTQKPKVNRLRNAKLFLFSPALDLPTNAKLGISVEEALIGTKFFDDWSKSRVKPQTDLKYLMGFNPFKYNVWLHAPTVQLIRLIQDTNAYRAKTNLLNPIFIAHSANDPATPYSGALRLCKDQNLRCHLCTLKDPTLSHAGIVLREDIAYLQDKADPSKKMEPEYHAKANVYFKQMMDKVFAFTDAVTAKKSMALGGTEVCGYGMK